MKGNTVTVDQELMRIIVDHAKEMERHQALSYWEAELPNLEAMGLVRRRGHRATVESYRQDRWMRDPDRRPAARKRPNRHDRKRNAARSLGMLREIVALLVGGG